MRASTTNPESTAPPGFVTLEEAARIARIGRTTAHDIAREYETTAGAHGLPVVRFGKQLRVPRYRLEDWLGGPITWPIADHDTPVASPVASPDTSITPVASAARVTRRATRPSGQNTLPFSA